MACSLCHSTETNDRLRNTIPLVGTLADRVRQALALGADALCFASGLLPKVCLKCVNNIETIESALKLRQKMRLLLDLHPSPIIATATAAASHNTHPGAGSTTATTALRASGDETPPDDSAAAAGEARVLAAEVAAPAIVTEADSSGQATDDRPAAHLSIAAVAAARRSAEVLHNGDVDVKGTRHLADPKTSPATAAAVCKKESNIMADFDETCRQQQQSSQMLGSPGQADGTPPTSAHRLLPESHSTAAMTNGSSVSAASQSLSERQLRSSSAASTFGAAASVTVALRNSLRSPEPLHGPARKVARTAAMASVSNDVQLSAVATAGSPPPPHRQPADVVGASAHSATSGGGGSSRQVSRTPAGHAAVAGGNGSVTALVVCKHCGKGFNSYSVLRVHLRSHTGEKPFTCRHCGVGFTQSQHARSHERRVHERTDGKQFRCSTCNAAYWRLGMLKAHERIHLQPAVATGSGGAALTASASHEVTVATTRLPRGDRALRGADSLMARAIGLGRGGRKRTFHSGATVRGRGSWYVGGDSGVRSTDDDDHELPVGNVDRGDDVRPMEAASRPSASAGSQRSAGRTQSKRYRCDQCNDAFWKIAHLARHKTLVHSATEDGAELLSTFADEPDADAMSSSSSLSSLHRDGLSTDVAAESGGEDSCEGSPEGKGRGREDASGIPHSRRHLDGSAGGSTAGAAAAAPGFGEPWPRGGGGRLSRVGGRRPRKSLRAAVTVDAYEEDDHDATASAVAAGVAADGRVGPSAGPQEVPELSFQSSSVFPRGDNDWVELSGISLASGAQPTVASLDAVIAGAEAATSAALSAAGSWHLSCSECNEHFAFKQGLQRHIKTVHVRKNKHACHACTASFILEKNLKQHVANAHTRPGGGGSSRGGAAAPFDDALGAKHADVNDVSREEVTPEDDASAATDADVSGAAAARPRASSAGSGAVDGDAETAASGMGSSRVSGDGVDGFGYSCKECGSTFRSKAVLRAHARVHEASDEFPYGCNICGARFMAEKYLTQHAVVHGEKQFECDVCRLRFSRRASLLQHMSCSHYGRCDYACDSCTATFNNPTALTKHKHRMHADDQYDSAAMVAVAAPTAEPAAATFEQRHQHSPSGQPSPMTQLAHPKPRRQRQSAPGGSCASAAVADGLETAAAQVGAPDDVATPRSPTGSAKPGAGIEAPKPASSPLQQGSIVYPPARFFECETCRSSFGSLSALSLHKHRVHGMPTARSARVPSTFDGTDRSDITSSNGGGKQSTASARGVPVVASSSSSAQPSTASTGAGGGINSGSSHLNCHLCNRKFSSMSSRAAHMRLHTGERPYACSVCGRRFVQSVHLKSHMRLHTGEKPYVCSVCGMAHRHRSGYMKHMRNHHGTSATETKGIVMGRNMRRGGAGRSTKASVASAAVVAAQTARPAQTSSKLIQDDVSESQSDLSFDNLADDQDSYDEIADGDATTLNEGSASGVLQHGDKAGDMRDIICDMCYEILPSPEAMKAHFLSAHSTRVPTGDAAGQQKSFSCSDCGERFLLRFLLKQHMKKRHDRALAD